jgi:hypothetical protein
MHGRSEVRIIKSASLGVNGMILKCKESVEIGFICVSIWKNVAVPWLRRFVAGLFPRRPGFGPGPVHVVIVVDEVALGQVL